MSALSEDQLAEFAAILASVDARVIVRGKPAPSILYDVSYHLAIVACAYVEHAANPSGRIVYAPWLKMVQFVATRPALVPDLKAWLSERKKTVKTRSLDAWARMPRGYLGDKTHEDTVQMLVAADVLKRASDDLQDGARVAYLDAFARSLEEEQLFVHERAVIKELVEVRPPKTALGGN